MIFVSRRLGKNRLLDSLRKFGLGRLTGIDLQEESTPILRPNPEWQDIDWATVSFGQGIAITRLQMLAAVNSLALGGRLLPPRVAQALESKGKTQILDPPPAIQVISQAAAAQVTQMMTNGVQKGEVRYYQVPGFKVAGKTGTAQVPISGHYDQDKVIASFVGFAPVDNPQFTMLVTLGEPQTSPWGSTTAAPLWFNIARDLFRYLRIPPRYPN